MENLKPTDVLRINLMHLDFISRNNTEKNLFILVNTYALMSGFGALSISNPPSLQNGKPGRYILLNGEFNYDSELIGFEMYANVPGLIVIEVLDKLSEKVY